MKKALAIILTVIIMVSVCPMSIFNISASAETNGVTGDCVWSLDGTVLTVSGNGAMDDYNYSYGDRAPWGTNVTEVIIEEGVTSIGKDAFYRCKKLINITTPKSLTAIYSHAFYQCSELNKIFIPEMTSVISSSAFESCSNLEKITVDAKNPNFSSINDILFSKDETKIILYPAGKEETSYIIPNTVTTIGSTAFYGCNNLESVVLPKSLTSIGHSAFGGCSNLKKVEIPYGATEIGDYAFRSCSGLISITIPDSITYVGDYAFEYCSIKEIVVAKGSKTFNSLMLVCEDTVENIIIPDGVKSITALFLHNDSLATINIPKSLKEVNYHSFGECYKLKKVFYRGTEEDKKDITNIAGGLKSATWYYNACIGTTVHNYDNVCDDVCNVCDSTRKITHTYKNDCDAECDICGFDRIPSEHIYDNVCDDDCNECYLERTVPDHNYTLNGGNTCDACKYSKAPNTPILDYKYSGTVFLVAINGLEYSKDGVTWQDSNVFTNLLPDTTYTFYQRVKTSAVALESEKSGGLIVNLKAAQATTPAAPIISSFTDTTVTLIPIADGEYSINGIEWQKNNIIEGLLPGTNYTLYQRYAENDTYEASNISVGTSITTDKAKQVLIPNVPIVQSNTANSITLTPVEGCEYSKNGTTWQASNVFSGLVCGTEYTFYQRYKETATNYAGKSSAALVTKTDKGIQTAPSSPTLLTKTHNSVTLTAISGYEYSRDGINWQISNVFTGLNAETNYMFYQRKAENERYYVSESSACLIVRTNEVPLYTPGDINDSGTAPDLDDVVTLAQIIAGWQGVIHNAEALDVNGDGNETLDDVVLLAQFVAGWNVTLN